MADAAKSAVGTRPRNKTIDSIRGVAILLVVLGHAIQAHVSDPESNLTFRLIYSFHMPLFMILSGWITNPDTAGRISKTIARLIPPFFAWYLIQYFAERDYRTIKPVRYLIQLCVSPETGLWFLWVLCVCICLLVTLRRAERVLGLWSYLAGLILICVLSIRVLGVPLVADYFPYVILGYLARRFKVNEFERRNAGVLACILIYAIALPYWHLSYSKSPGIGASVFGLHWRIIHPAMFLIPKVAAGVCGSVVVSAVVAWFHLRVRSLALPWLGEKTMEIYVSHQLFMHWFSGTGVLKIAASFAFALVASLAIAAVFQRVPLTRRILYGQ